MEFAKHILKNMNDNQLEKIWTEAGSDWYLGPEGTRAFLEAVIKRFETGKPLHDDRWLNRSVSPSA